MRNAIAVLFGAALVVASGSAPAQEYVTFGSSGSGGTYSIIAAAIAKVVNETTPGIQMNVEATPGGGLGNVRLLAQGKLDFGLATAADSVAAWRGAPPFDKKKADNIRTLLVGTSLPFHVVVADESEIRSIADLKGKKVVTNSSANSLTFVPDALAVYGLHKGSDYALANQSTNEAIEAFKDGRVHAFASFFFMPASALVDLGTSRKLRYLPMAPDKIQDLVKGHEIYSSAVIPGGVYPDQPQAVETAAITVAIYTHERVPAEIAYKVTKAILEHPAELAGIYKPAATFSIERQKQQFANGEIVPPLHDGARRYLGEVKALP